MAIKEQKRKRKEEIQNQRLQLKQELKRPIRHNKDPFGLNALSDLFIGHLGGGHHSGHLLGHHSGLGSIGGHKIGHGLHGHHGGIHHGHHGDYFC